MNQSQTKRMNTQKKRLFFKWLGMFFTGGVLLLLGSCSPAPCSDSSDCPPSYYCDTQLFACVSGEGECRVGSIRPCFTGPEKTINVGECKPGRQTCNPQRTWGPCLGQVTPIAEICDDNKDNDCNGEIDNDCANPKQCRAIDFQKIVQVYAHRHKEEAYQMLVRLTLPKEPVLYHWNSTLQVQITAQGRWQLLKQTISSESKNTVELILQGDGKLFADELTLRLTGQVLNTENGTTCDVDFVSSTFSTRCSSAFQSCDGYCIPKDSFLHCGRCDLRCKPGEECCQEKCRKIVPVERQCTSCEIVCQPGESCCKDLKRCVDLQIDEQNCGACGRACASDQICCQGICIRNGHSNCGKCGRSCNSNEFCCENACVSPFSNRNHCGQCGDSCPDKQICVQAQCEACPADKTFCSTGEKQGDCFDLKSNPSHCGACGNVCEQGQACQNGQCGACLHSGVCQGDNVCRKGGQCVPSVLRSNAHQLVWHGISRDWNFVANNQGDIYITGSFQGRLSIGNRTIQSLGGWDIFVGLVHFRNGQDFAVQWLEQIGGKGDEHSPSIHRTANSRYLLSGIFGEGQQPAKVLDVLNPAATQISPLAKDTNGIFVLSLNPDGSKHWVKTVGGTITHKAPKLSTNPTTGDALLHFETNGTSQLQALTCDSQKLSFPSTDSGSNQTQTVALHMDAKGSCLWVRRLGGAGETLSFSSSRVLVSASQSTQAFALVGQLTGKMQWGGKTLESFQQGTKSSSILAYLSKTGADTHASTQAIVAESQLLDVFQFPTQGNHVVGQFLTSASNYTAGFWSYVNTWSQSPLGFSPTVTFAGSGHVTLQKVLETGGSTPKVYIGGTFEGEILLPNNVKLKSHGKSDIFIVRLDRVSGKGSNGLEWSLQVGGTGEESLTHLSFDSNTNSLLVGGSSDGKRIYLDKRLSVQMGAIQASDTLHFLWRLEP
ncbi:MAG: hypothetical protein EP343_23110 [Deltaproteobacteria bacterium]|nr:MAG: hypothetical protein EP343_23110 [Deltaproteobacteria bacterium]